MKEYIYHIRIVCAAYKYVGYTIYDDVIVIGPRHGSPIMNVQIDEYEKNLLIPEGAIPIQGFIDQHGVFYNRREAWRIAESAGQILRRCGGDDSDGGTLYSENLY